jgi:hypothetical protein
MRNIAIIINIILVILEVVDLVKSFPQRGWITFAFYTTLSNVMTFLSSLALLIACLTGSMFDASGHAAWFPVILRYLASCMMLMTFITTAFILVPLGGNAKQLLFTEGLLHHLVCPILCIVSYVWFEPHARAGAWLVPVVLTFCYGMLMFWLNYKRRIDGPYPFFRVHRQGKGGTIMWMCILTAIITVMSLIVRALAR